jgi:adenylylsulfate kinase
VRRVRATPLRTLSVRRLMTTAVGKTLVIWMDRISDGRLADTNTLSIPPVTADGMPRYWAERISGRLPGVDPRRPSVLFVRRHQPFHEGDRRLIEEGIRRVDQAGIAARDTRGGGNSNPLSLFDVKPRIDNAMRSFWAHIRLSGCLT